MKNSDAWMLVAIFVGVPVAVGSVVTYFCWKAFEKQQGGLKILAGVFMVFFGLIVLLAGACGVAVLSSGRP